MFGRTREHIGKNVQGTVAVNSREGKVLLGGSRSQKTQERKETGVFRLASVENSHVCLIVQNKNDVLRVPQSFTRLQSEGDRGKQFCFLDE